MFRKSETERPTLGFLSTVKKLFAIAFTCVYLTLAVGVVHTTHYCMGRVNSSTLFSFQSAKCPCFVASKYGKDTCCEDEHEIIKIDDDHAASSVVSLAPVFFEIGNILNESPSVEISQGLKTNVDQSLPPPDPIPLFTKHCSLVFYDDEMIA